jgi:glycosyltransferase involved in cell wall biosynthesis
MKILIVQDVLRSGGTERQSVLLANAFAAAGHEATLLTFRPGGALDATVTPAVRRLALQPFDTGLDWFAPRLRTVATRADPQVVLCMGRMANCQAGALQRHLPNAAVLATMRTGQPLPARFRASLQVVRGIVANSADARDTLVARYGAPARRISVIHNSLVFPAASADGSRAELRQAHGAGPGTLVLLCVAMFRPEKNQRELVEIVAGLPASLDCQLWLAGDGRSRGECETRARAAGIGARVRFLGFQRDPSGLYAAADVAVHASASESLSNFLIEAQAHGVPAVAYAAQGIGECFVPGETGWVIPRDDRDRFRATLQRLAAASADERATRSAAARTFARTAFDPAQQVRAYLELFARLTDTH